MLFLCGLIQNDRDMKKLLVIMLCVLSIANKASAKGAGYFYFKLTDIEVTNRNKGTFSNEQTRHGIEFSNYSDESIDAEFVINPTHVSLVLKNKTDYTVKIFWDEAVFVDLGNVSTPVIHEGTKFIKKDETQLPSIIIKGSILDDLIIPKNKITYLTGKNGGWRIGRIFSYRERTEGKIIKFHIPIEINEEKVEYTFTFASNYEIVKKVRLRNTGYRLIRYYEIRR